MFVRRWRSWLAAWLVGAAGVSMAGAAFPQVADAGAHEGGPAQTPLSEIAGAAAPPPVTVVPLEDVPSVQTAVEQARAWIEDGRFQDAVEALSGALEETGGDRYEVHYLLALAKTRLGQFDAAGVSAAAAARLGHGDANVHYLLAQIYRGQGETEAAIAHYRSATLAAERELNNPKVTRAWYSLGQLLEQGGYDLAAAEAYAQFDTALWQTHAEQRNAPDFAALLAQRPYGMVPQRWELLVRLGRERAGLGVAEWAHGIWPDDLSMDRLYARALLSAGEAERAFTFCHRRLDYRRAAGALLPIAVNAARAANRLPGWLEEVVSGIAEGRGLEQARMLTRILQEAGESAEAVCVGQALLLQRPADEEISWEVAGAQQALGDLRDALETLIAFVRSSPDLAELPGPRLARWRGWFESVANVAELVKELRARPDADFATDFVLGVSALAADQPELADELLQACVASRPDFTPAYVVQGEMLLANHQWDASKQFAEGVLEEHPELVAARYLLGQAHEGLDENEQAERAYKQAIKLRPEEPTYSLALARHYLRLGNLRGAQRYFQQALTEEPGSGPALEGLIDCYLRSGKIEIARSQLERLDRDAVPADTLRRVDTLMRFVSDPFGAEHLAELGLQFERYPDDIATARLLAGGLYYRGRLEETRAVIEQVRGKHPDDYHLTVLLANVHAQRGEFDQAISLLNGLARRLPNRLKVLEPLAEYRLNDFRFEEGRLALRRVIELEEDGPERAAHQRKLRDSFVVLGEYDQALRLVEAWIKNEPDNERLLLHKAIVLVYAERMQEAFGVLEAWLKLNPRDPDRRERFCEMGPVTEQYEQIIARIRTWLEHDESDVSATNWLIDVLLRADRAEEALEIAREFEGTYAESFERRIWLGRCQAGKGEIAKALEEFDALLNERLIRDDQRRDVWEQIALTLISAERHDDLLMRCEGWLEQSERLNLVFRPIALHWKRQALQVAGRDRESAEVMEALVAYVPAIAEVLGDPDYNGGLFNDLGYVWADLGMNLERAGNLIRLAVAAEPWNAAFLDSLGWVYYKAGDFSNARKYLARAARLRDGQDPVVYDHLADAAYRLGDRESAREYWDKAVSLLETELSEREQARLTELLAAVRAKLTALERSETPAVAPTAAEQHKDQN